MNLRIFERFYSLTWPYLENFIFFFTKVNESGILSANVAVWVFAEANKIFSILTLFWIRLLSQLIFVEFFGFSLALEWCYCPSRQRFWRWETEIVEWNSSSIWFISICAHEKRSVQSVIAGENEFAFFYVLLVKFVLLIFKYCLSLKYFLNMETLMNLWNNS